MYLLDSKNYILTADLTSLLKKEPIYRHMAITALKYLFRAVNTAFLLYIFVRVPPRVCAIHGNRTKIVNHFLVPALMLSIVAAFASSVVDEFHG